MHFSACGIIKKKRYLKFIVKFFPQFRPTLSTIWFYGMKRNASKVDRAKPSRELCANCEISRKLSGSEILSRAYHVLSACYRIGGEGKGTQSGEMKRVAECKSRLNYVAQSGPYFRRAFNAQTWLSDSHVMLTLNGIFVLGKSNSERSGD